jgi:tRNA-dihydrouridine synthase A
LNQDLTRPKVDLDRTLCVAPMMDWTDRHCRYFHRLLAPDALLYTEMITSGAVIHGDRQHLIGFSPAEHPVAIQLGGSDPADLAFAAKIVEEFGYDEINLNVGCPSDRVQSGCFGASLMLEPERVADCVQAMLEAVQIPVTVKHRIGVDDQDENSDLQRFVELVAERGCRTFIVHARKAWLQGLSPKQNRDVPPLNYQRVYDLKQDFPDLEIIINGGIESPEEIDHHLRQIDGVMLGRLAYHNPYRLAEIQRQLFARPDPLPGRESFAMAMMDYAHKEVAAGTFFKHISRHILGLYQAVPGARAWRRTLSENACLRGADESVIRLALAAVEALAHADSSKDVALP